MIPWDLSSVIGLVTFYMVLSDVFGTSTSVPANDTLLPTPEYRINTTFDASQISDEKRLVRSLLHKYELLGREGRPVINSSTPVQVAFGMGLIKMELHEKENMLSMSTWARYQWRDEYLQWDPSDFGGIAMVKLHHDKIWIPDIMLYNTANTDESEREVMVVVRADGTVTWYPHKVFQSSCAIDVTNYPFDNQTCYLWFGSWTHTLDEVDVQLAFPNGIDLSTFISVYKDSSEWDIVNSTAERKVMPPDDKPQFAILSFTLHLKRKVMFSTYILTMPAIFLSFLTLLVFWLPPEHADKSGLGLTIFGSLLLLLLILVEAAPPTASAVPLLGIFYCFTTVIVILSIFLSSMVIKIGKQGDKGKRVPMWLKTIIFNGLGRVLCMPFNGSVCGKKRSVSLDDIKTHGEEHERELLDKSVCNTREETEEIRFNGAQNVSIIACLERRLRALQAILEKMVKKQNDKETCQRIQYETEQEWRHIALVLDRLFLYAYLIGIIISLMLLFPKSPLSGMFL